MQINKTDLPSSQSILNVGYLQVKKNSSRAEYGNTAHINCGIFAHTVEIYYTKFPFYVLVTLNYC